MSTISIAKRALIVLGLTAGLVGAFATSQASAFGFHGGNMGGMGGHIGGHTSFHPGGGFTHPGNFDQRHPIRQRPGLGERGHGPVECFRAPCNIGHRPPPIRCHIWGSSCGGRIANHCRPWDRWCHVPPIQRCNWWNHWCRPVWTAGGPRPIVTPRPIYSAAAPSYVAPATYSPPAQAPTCTPTGAYISVVFQPNATATDITEFLKAYQVTMGDGPNNDGVYRVRLPQNTPQDQIGQVIESMRSQTTVVSSVSS